MPDDYSTPPSAQSGAAAPEAKNGALGLEALVESLLFVADGPVPVARIAEALEATPREVEAALAALDEAYAAAHRGVRLQRYRDRVQLTTAPAAAEQVERFLGLATTAPLTRASLETLAIIAYQQPVTRPRIDAVRGVNSDSVIKNLLSKGLIEEVGRAEGPGRPLLYATTPEFLQHFGLTSLADLPPLNLDAPPTLTGEAPAPGESRAEAAAPPESPSPAEVPKT
jgi:segregation and condensation protein B